MSKEKTNTIRVGLFVVAAFILFAIAIYNIGNKQNLFGATFSVSSVFKNVKGLQPGNNVRYAGINVGSVADIVLLNDSTIRVDMQMQQKVKAYLKKDAVASIGSDGLVGNMIVNISPGKGFMPAVEDGDILDSYTRVETEEMLNTLGNTTENIALLTVNLLEITEKINKGKGSLPMLINNRGLAEDLQAAIKNLRQTTAYVEVLSRQLQRNIGDIDDGKGLLGYLLRDTTLEKQLDQIAGEMDALVSNRLTPTMENLEQSSLSIKSTSTELEGVVEEIDLNEGLVGAILKDTTVAEDFRQTLQNLNEGTDRFNQNMEAMKHNFLFRRYFKKQEKEKRKAEKNQS